MSAGPSVGDSSAVRAAGPQVGCERRCRRGRLLLHAARQVSLGKELALGQNAGALDDVAKLSDVAVPPRRREHPLASRRQADDRLAEAAGALADERRGEIRNIFRTVPKRRQRDPDDVESVEEVTPKTSVPDLGCQVAVRRGDHLRIHTARRQGPDALHFARFENAEQFGLHRQRQLAHLIEKQVPPSAISNNPGLSSVAPVNAPRLCPKSSLSKSVSTTAEQLTVTKRRRFRGPSL